MNLRQFITRLRDANDLCVVTQVVDPHLEISALAARSARENGPALLFARPRNSFLPVLINGFAASQRLALALNHASLDDFGQTAHALLQAPNKLSSSRVVVDPRTANLRTVHSGPNATFEMLPQTTFWPGDAGPCLTAAVVVTRHPETKQINAGIYRVQILDRSTAILGWHPGSDAADHFAAAQSRGRPLDVALVLGAPAAVTLAASFPLPSEVDEFRFAAHFQTEPLGMTFCATMDLLVPVESQIILEGVAALDQVATEGPFANHTGRQTAPRPAPVFHLKALSFVAEPVFQAIALGPPPSESCWTAKAFEPILRRHVMLCHAEVLDMHLPLEGIFQNLAFFRIADTCSRPLDLLAALLEIPALRRFRYLVAVDEAVNVRETSNVLWRIGNCADPAVNIRVVQGSLAPWHDSATPGHGAKMLIDATRKRYHTTIRHDPDLEHRVQALWRQVSDITQSKGPVYPLDEPLDAKQAPKTKG